MKRHPRLQAFAAAAATALVLTACGTTDDNEDTTDNSGSEVCDLKLGFFGALTGPAANLGINIKQGVELAVDEYNAENEDCKVTLVEYDSQGSETEAPPLAQGAVDDAKVIGVVGPAFSGESKAAGDIFAEAGLTTITPSATNPTLADNGWDTFHRMLGNDATQGPAAAKYIADTIESDAVFVADDASEYGKGLSDIVSESLGDAVVDTATIQAGDTDFSTLVTAVKGSKADTVFFGGYIAEAGLILKQLREGGFEGQYVVADGAKDPQFVETAQADNAEGTIITCPCIPPEDEAVAEFAAAYEAAYDVAPGTYTAEGYDAANAFLDGIADGVTDREGMLEFINGYDAAGVTKQVKFDDKGEPAEVPIYAYEVKDGEIVGLSLIE